MLEKLSKEELIKVIGNMHDAIQEWDNGYGLPEKDSEILIEIGKECTKFCVVNGFDLPITNEKK